VLTAHADEALAVPAREELLGPSPADSDDWLALDDLPALVVPFDPTLSLTGVTEFFHGERRDPPRAAVVPMPAPNVSSVRKFIDQFDRFASDFHAFAAECRSAQRP